MVGFTRTQERIVTGLLCGTSPFNIAHTYIEYVEDFDWNVNGKFRTLSPSPPSAQPRNHSKLTILAMPISELACQW